MLNLKSKLSVGYRPDVGASGCQGVVVRAAGYMGAALGAYLVATRGGTRW